MKKYQRLLSVAVMIGTLKVNIVKYTSKIFHHFLQGKTTLVTSCLLALPEMGLLFEKNNLLPEKANSFLQEKPQMQLETNSCWNELLPWKFFFSPQNIKHRSHIPK